VNRILILGASGFIGNTIYKELLSYFDVYGTYRKADPDLDKNQVMFQYDIGKDDIEVLLNKIRPNVIVSSMRGDFDAQLKAHHQILNFATIEPTCRVLFLSTVNVFDGKDRFPSFEGDRTLASSEYGKYKSTVEKLFANLPKEQVAILRLPMVLGVNSPRVQQLKQAIKHKAEFEVYSNLVISTTTAKKVAQQVHYIINQYSFGIFHLASNDVIHHEDLFVEISEKLGDKKPIFKSVYNSNEDSFLAILPKENTLPENYQITVAEVIEDSTLKDEIVTLKL